MTSKSVRGRWWLLTMNNPVLSFERVYELGLMNMKALKYMVGQLEIGDKKMTPHFQFCIWTSESVRAAAVHKGFPGCHVEFINNPEAAIAYCRKETGRMAGPWELGIRPVRRNSKVDWERVHMLARTNQINLIPAQIQIMYYGNLLKIRDANLQALDAPHGKVRGVWVYGPPDTGKSYFCRNFLGTTFVYPKAQNKWWDGYQQQKVVVLDDMDNDCLAHFMKIWADVYSFTAEAKGTTVAPNHRILAVTSNKTIEQVYEKYDQEFIQAIRRRFIVIETFESPLPTKEGVVDYDGCLYALHRQVRTQHKGIFKIETENFIGPMQLSEYLCEHFGMKSEHPAELPCGESREVEAHVSVLLEEEKANDEDAQEQAIERMHLRMDQRFRDPEEATFVDEQEFDEYVATGYERGLYADEEDVEELDRIDPFDLAPENDDDDSEIERLRSTNGDNLDEE